MSNSKILYLEVLPTMTFGDVLGNEEYHIRQMRLAQASTIHARGSASQHAEYDTDNLPSLFEAINDADIVVGFNIRRFDYIVLAPYAEDAGVSLDGTPTFDIFAEIYEQCGTRISLDNLRKHTLGETDTRPTLESQVWLWRAEKFDKLEEIGRETIDIVRRIFYSGCRHEKVTFWHPNLKKVVTLDVSHWRTICRKLVGIIRENPHRNAIASCKACGDDIQFIETPTGRYIPCNFKGIKVEPIPTRNGEKEQTFVGRDGKVFKGYANHITETRTHWTRWGYEPHWATCPNADEFRKAK